MSHSPDHDVRQVRGAVNDYGYVASQQQPMRVVVEKKPSGCWTAFGVLLLIGLAIKYWYVSLGILVLAAAATAIAHANQKQQQRAAEQKAAHRSGPRDPWLNEVAVALADLGFVEGARNTGDHIGGVPIEGDIRLDTDGLTAYITLFATDELARQAEIALRANPEVRAAESNGHSAVRSLGRVLYTANGRGGVVDDFRFDEVVRVVDKLSLPPPLPRALDSSLTSVPRAERSAARVGVKESDALEQIRTLGKLRDAGVLTGAEFDAKKAELLRRV